MTSECSHLIRSYALTGTDATRCNQCKSSFAQSLFGYLTGTSSSSYFCVYCRYRYCAVCISSTTEYNWPVGDIQHLGFACKECVSRVIDSQNKKKDREIAQIRQQQLAFERQAREKQYAVEQALLDQRRADDAKENEIVRERTILAQTAAELVAMVL